MNRIKPLTAFFNKDYKSKNDGALFLEVQKIFVDALIGVSSSRQLPEHIFYSDDCFVIFRNLGFLTDRDFVSSVNVTKLDPVLMGRLWRAWVVAWSFKSCWTLSGDHIDCGTYNGAILQLALNYTLGSERPQDCRKRVFACDMFENPPEESRKAEHSAELFSQVSERLKSYDMVKVVKGQLPNSLSSHTIESVAWCQIDLNSADADAACFVEVAPKLVDGAIVIFDDYGFSRYKDTQVAIDQVAADFGQRVLELPTGQGLYIHRSYA